MRGPEGYIGIEGDKPREACGVFGVYAPGQDVVRMAYIGGQMVQNRGQDAAGISVLLGDRISLHKGKGTVVEVFHNDATLDQIDPHHEADIASSHTLYGTMGDGNGYQPIEGQGESGKLFTLSHNGHLEPKDGSGIGSFPSDSFWLTDRISRSWVDGRSLEEAIAIACDGVNGAYSCVVVGDGKLIAFRDPHGIRPLSMAKLPDDGGYVVSSETLAFQPFRATDVQEIAPGTIMSIDKDGPRPQRFAEAKPNLCLFEYIYFTHQGSELNGVSANRSRHMAGELLAGQMPVEADLVIGVPASGVPAAEGYARASRIRFGNAIERNPYVTRTFIKQSADVIRDAIRMKLFPLRDMIKDQRIVVVDDSVMRGNTLEILVQMLKEAEPTEIHLRIASPPNKWPCYYGMATGKSSQLIANKVPVSEMAAHFGVDSFDYLSLENLVRSTAQDIGALCTGCLTGVYPTEEPVDILGRK